MNILEHFKIPQLNTLPDISSNTIPKSTSGKVLLYDGDAACYKITSKVAKIETALKHFETDIYTMMYLSNCSSAKVFLTPRGCLKRNRDSLNTVLPYQGNRDGKAKPPLLEVLRAQAVNHFKSYKDIEVIPCYDVEADDGLITAAYTLDNTCMISFDKDLRMNPFESYDADDCKSLILPKGDTFGYIERKQWLTPSGKQSSKLVGKGLKFFYAQLLMGDTADHVKGLVNYRGKSIGEAGTFKLLDPITDVHECANFVIDAYREINQNVVAEGEAMWLIRNADDSAFKYLLEQDLSPSNKQYIYDCNETAWST